VRLRLTGHDRDSIARVIRDSAPALRRGERRDWDAYARRAVDFAFGLAGSRLLQQLERQREHLLSIEGRSLEDRVPSRRRGRAPLGR
jgi:DNA primase RepB-like protein